MTTESRLVVVDASVVIKWDIDDEEYVSEARALRNDYLAKESIRVISPQLMIYEVVNGIVTASRNKRIAPERAVEVVSNLLAAGIELKEVPAFRILELCLRHKLSAYDAAYLALAEDEKCDLWTGDRVFYRAVKAESHCVKWIGDYRS